MQDGGQIEGSQEPNPNDIIMAYAQSKGLSEEQLNQLIQQLQGLPEEDQMMALQEMMADLQGGTEQGMMQEGGEMGGQADAQMEQLQQQVAQALQQGTDPNQVIQQLVQMGLPQDQAVAMVQQIMQALEQGQGQAPAMKRGGKVKKIIML
jgi:Rad3-related DNA helicase